MIQQELRIRILGVTGSAVMMMEELALHSHLYHHQKTPELQTHIAVNSMKWLE